MQDVAMSLPGVDEAMSFAEIMKQLKSMTYSTIVFDTAPTGHTLRFLNFPAVLTKALERLSQMMGRLGPLMNQFGPMMGMSNPEELFGKLEGTRQTIREVLEQFQNPDLTTFVCVCISEFLSLYETERMIQELLSFGIDTHNIVINQLLLNPTDGCEQCTARKQMQQKYLDQFHDLYEDFHLVKLPQVPQEVRGAEALKKFSRLLLEPYKPGMTI